MERSIRLVTFPSHLSFSSALSLSFVSYCFSFSPPLTPPFLFYKGLKSLIVASPNQTALLNVPEPVLIRPEESFHLPLYTPKLGILAMEINNHLSSILKRDFFNSEPKDAENLTLIQIRIAKSRHGISTERDLAFIR